MIYIRIFVLWLFLVVAITALGYSAADWRISKLQWSNTDEQNWQQFVASIGQAVRNRSCRNIRECLQSSSNPYRYSDSSGLSYFVDCADLPYYMRAYFSWKNKLPFAMADEMGVRNVEGNTSSDIRYSRYGNFVRDRRSTLTSSTGRFSDAFDILNEWVPSYTSSANYRTFYNDNDESLSDFYPIKIDRDSVKPGSIVYDPNGHVVLIYDITDDGRVLYFDAHPDNSLTAGTYGKKFVRSHPSQGAGFKKFRPIMLVGATPDRDGNLLGGRVVLARNEEIADFSPEGLIGTQPDPNGEWQKGAFIINGQFVDFYDYVRMSLSKGNLQIEPNNEVRTIVQDICNSIKDRIPAVHESIQSGIINKSHPERLPRNIYGTDGEWETYSTPSRDARLKVQFKELRDQIENMIHRFRNHDPQIVYRGNDIVGDIYSTYMKEVRSCIINYTNSVGTSVSLDMLEITRRLFYLSFDPYHCVELRWGATSGQELATCQDDNNKRLWYQREQFLRNQVDRRYDDQMDFNLEELATLRPGNGVATPPDVDVIKLLQNIR